MVCVYTWNIIYTNYEINNSLAVGQGKLSYCFFISILIYHENAKPVVRSGRKTTDLYLERKPGCLENMEERMKKLVVLLCTALITTALAGTAFATSMTFSGNVNPTDPGTVDYQYFTIDADDLVNIETFTETFDPMIYLFSDDGSLDTSDYITYDDDSGTRSDFGFSNSLISTNLTAGSYIVAVADFHLSLNEAVTGINGSDSNIGSGTYELVVSAESATVSGAAPIPEPATMFLLGSGLLCLVGVRKKYIR